MVVEKKLIGSRLRKLRDEKKISQGVLAEFLGVTASCVANWETGSRAPDINILGVLAEYFGVSVDYLCCRSNQRNYLINSAEKADYGIMLDLSGLSEENRERIKKYYDFLSKGLDMTRVVRYNNQAWYLSSILARERFPGHKSIRRCREWLKF